MVYNVCEEEVVCRVVVVKVLASEEYLLGPPYTSCRNDSGNPAKMDGIRDWPRLAGLLREELLGLDGANRAWRLDDETDTSADF